MQGAAFLQHVQAQVELNLAQALGQAQVSLRLSEAMAYSCLDGGKRIRAALVFATAHACGTDSDYPELGQLAAAVEALHAYSLIHDDLPAMDDDALRRGKPTSHIAFDEATAILAGDALQSMAFELTAGVNGPNIGSNQTIAMVQALGKAAGARGMVAGQMLDMAAEKTNVELAELEQVHAHKTGALIVASIELGALTSAHVSSEQLANLREFGRLIGLAFQVHDDILDIEGDTQTLGKAQGADIQRGKSTYPSLLGMQQAKQLAKDLHANALQQLQTFGDAGQHLAFLANYIVQRKY